MEKLKTSPTSSSARGESSLPESPDPILVRQLIRDEGLRLKPYRDTVGKITIGIGRNLTDRGIDEGEAVYLFQNDIEDTQRDLDRRLPWWRDLDPPRQRVMINLAFNMGIGGLLTFKNTLRAIREHRWKDARRGILLSKYHRQVGQRAVRLADTLLDGIDR